MRAPFYIVLFLIFGIMLLGIATLQSGVLTLSIPLMAYLFAAIVQRPEGVQLAATREVSPDYAPQGTPIKIRLILTNQGAAIDELTVQDVLPDGVKLVEGKPATVSSLEPQGKITLEYTVAASRGEYNAYEVLIYARDSRGLFSLPLVFRTTPRLIVRPHYPKLDRIKIRPPQTRGFAGPIASRQGGTGTGFWGIREYQSGDPQHQINWRLAARPGQELYTNVYEQERVADVGLILDARQRTNVIVPSGSLFEHAVRAAAALSDNLLDDGNRVGLLVYGAAISRVFPGYGRVQRDRILKALSKAKPGVNYALESLANLPTRFFPAKSQIIMVSPLLPEDIPVIVRMRAHGYAVIVISPDPIAFESTGDGHTPAYRIAFAERAFMLHQIRRSGAQIVNWHVDQPLEIAMRDALALQPTSNNRIGL